MFRLLTCHFTTEAKLSGPVDSFDLGSNKTHLLLSTGPSGPTEAEPLSYHVADKVSSGSGIRFDRFVMVEPVVKVPGDSALIKEKQAGSVPEKSVARLETDLATAAGKLALVVAVAHHGPTMQRCVWEGVCCWKLTVAAVKRYGRDEGSACAELVQQSQIRTY